MIKNFFRAIWAALNPTVETIHDLMQQLQYDHAPILTLLQEHLKDKYQTTYSHEERPILYISNTRFKQANIAIYLENDSTITLWRLFDIDIPRLEFHTSDPNCFHKIEQAIQESLKNR